MHSYFIRLATIHAVLAIFSLAPTPLPAQEAAPTSDLEQRLRGVWSAAETQQTFLFDGPRCVVAYGLQQSIMSVDYLEDGTTIERRLLSQEMAPSVATVEFESDDEARLVGKQRTLTLTRIGGLGDDLPEAVRTEPMQFGARELTAEQIEDLGAGLIERRDREQAVRAELSATQQKIMARYAKEGIQGAPWQDPELQPVISKMHGIDKENTRYLKDLMADIGWIDAKRFGDAVNQSAFLIVQHCGNVAMLQPVMEAMKAEFEAGHKASGPRFALMYDRLTLALGGEQRYGSQLQPRPDGSLHFPRLEDVANIDALRAGVGLEPLSVYAKRMGNTPVELPEGYESSDG